MKVFIWFVVVIAVFLVSYSYAADPIPIRTDCFDATLTYGINTTTSGVKLPWVKVDELTLKRSNVSLRFNTQLGDGTEKSGVVFPSDTFNGHTVYYNIKHIKFSVEVLLNNETQYTTEYVEF